MQLFCRSQKIFGRGQFKTIVTEDFSVTEIIENDATRTTKNWKSDAKQSKIQI